MIRLLSLLAATAGAWGLVFAGGMTLAACVSDYSEPTPAQFRQAEADCAPHDGLKRVRVAEILLNADLVAAECGNGVEIHRRVKGTP